MSDSRSISPTLGVLLERFELDRPSTVTLAEIADLAEESGIRTPARILAHRLVKKGWLLETRVPGVWEFAPADRAGPISNAGPFLTVKAVLARSDVSVSVALGSALWIHNFADRAPAPHELAIPSRVTVPRALKTEYRVVRFRAALQPLKIDDVPVHHPATILVHMAQRPNDVKSWAGMLELLPDLLSACDIDEIRSELAGRPHATHVRLAYLLDGFAPQLVRELEIESAGKVWFGPRRTLRRHDARWNVADTLLPFSPLELGKIGDR